MFKKIIKYIHNLRIFFLFFIIFSFFYIYSISPIDLSRFLGASFGRAVGVGMSTSVPENPFNKLASDLKEKEDHLNEKEQNLENREKKLDSLVNISENKLVLSLIIGIIILFLLIILNYYLDYRRKKMSVKK